MTTHKDKVLQKMKELQEYKKFKENSVMIQLPYGLPHDNFKIHAVVSKEAVEQMKEYDRLMKDEIDKYVAEMKPKEEPKPTETKEETA